MGQQNKKYYETESECFAVLRQFILFSQKNSQLSGLSSEQFQLLLAIKGIANHEKVSIAKIADLLLLEQDAAKQLCAEAENQHLINQQDDQITITIKVEELLNEIFLKDEFGVAQMQKKFNTLFQ